MLNQCTAEWGRNMENDENNNLKKNYKQSLNGPGNNRTQMV